MTHNNSRKLSTTQIIAIRAWVLLFCAMLSQVMGNDFLSERFAVLFYFWLIALTFSAITENYHDTVIQWLSNNFSRLHKFNTNKHYRWTYLCYFVFVVVMIWKYWFTDGVAFFTFIMGWLMIYFPWYYFFILSGIYILIFRYLWETSTHDLQYSITYVVCWVITTYIASKKFFK